MEYDYGIIWIKPQHTDKELPMSPITAMRNSLGKEHAKYRRRKTKSVIRFELS